MGEMRKHRLHMTGKELFYLEKEITKAKRLNMTCHLVERMNEKKITQGELNYALKNYDIVEFHRKNNSNRVLIRSNQGKSCICIVICLDNSNIVTAYKNSKTDKHQTIKWEEYSDFNILDYIEPKIKYNYERKICYET